MRTLIVDDDLVCRKVLSVALGSYGVVDEAASGEEALERFRAAHRHGDPYALVTLDIMMPHLDGHAVLEQLRAYELASPGITSAVVLMTSALDDGRNVDRAFRHRADGYLVKPIDLEGLFGQLRMTGLIPDKAPPPRRRRPPAEDASS